ncbi:MAG: hypothetical protein KDA92_10200, partial [Planctomycetales bacterium]|nr:hypothetical protein [Planctomycetales bacterium]
MYRSTRKNHMTANTNNNSYSTTPFGNLIACLLDVRSWRKPRPQRSPLARSLIGKSSISAELLEDRCVLAPVPVVGLNVPAESMIGEAQTFTVSFDNQATGAPLTGYGPY